MFLEFCKTTRLDLVGFSHMSVGKKNENPDISAHTEKPTDTSL